MRIFLAGIIAVLSTSAGSLYARADLYSVTAAEKAACTGDATSFCADTYPDETALMSCMKTHMPELSGSCRPVFKAGLQRRHLR